MSLHVFTEGTVAYARALAQLASGRAELAGERYDERGRHVLAVRVGGYRRNDEQSGVMRIGQEYFSLALKDYRDWPEKWWREAVQNSIDAGARTIKMLAVTRDDGLREITCEDDGRGMDRQTLLDKFLVLGGSGKPAEGQTVGGFGKAKELLVLPWIAWKIASHDYVVEGHGANYEITSVAPRRGTRLSVVMPSDKCTDEFRARSFISKCYLPSVTFLIGEREERAAALLKPGKVIREEEQFRISYNKRADVQGMFIRVNGLFMFSRWVTVGGAVIVELLGRSTELLTANRDSFREWRIDNAMDKFANDLAANTKSALDAKKNVLRIKYEGRGLIARPGRGAEVEQMAYTLQRALDDVTAKDGRLVVGERLAREIGGALPSDTTPDPERPAAYPASPDLARAMLQGTSMWGPTHVQSAAKSLAWEPDFFIFSDDADWRLPVRFTPEKMPPSLVRLTRFWAELCRFVLVQLGRFRPYGVGWYFKETAAAAYYRHEDKTEWLLLNPFVHPEKRDELFSLSNPKHVAFLYAAAVHEVTHLANDVPDHNEDFSSALTENFAICYGKERQVRAIRQAVVARSAHAGGSEFEV